MSMTVRSTSLVPASSSLPVVENKQRGFAAFKGRLTQMFDDVLNPKRVTKKVAKDVRNSREEFLDTDLDGEIDTDHLRKVRCRFGIRRSDLDTRAWALLKSCVFQEEVDGAVVQRVDRCDGEPIMILPQKLFELGCVILARLHKQSIQCIPPQIESWRDLKTLDLTDNGLISLPPQIKECTKLETLILSDNKLGALTSKISKLVNLRRLLLDQNHLEKVPSLKKLKSLETLCLDYNLIKSFEGADLGKLSSLRSFSAANNQLGEIPEGLTSYSKLEKCLVACNKIEHLPKEFARLTALEQLDISNNMLRKISGGVAGCTQLSLLLAPDNKIQKISKKIGALKELTRLDVSKNEIKELPDKLARCAGLVELLASHNKICKLPRKIGNLQELDRMDLSDNKLKEIDSEQFARLIELRELNLSKNLITDFPEGLAVMGKRLSEIIEVEGGEKIRGHLRMLDISSNRLQKTLPRECSLSCLKVLDVSGNPDFTVGSWAEKEIPSLEQLIADDHQKIKETVLKKSERGQRNLAEALGAVAEVLHNQQKIKG